MENITEIEESLSDYINVKLATPIPLMSRVNPKGKVALEFYPKDSRYKIFYNEQLQFDGTVLHHAIKEYFEYERKIN